MIWVKVFYYRYLDGEIYVLIQGIGLFRWLMLEVSFLKIGQKEKNFIWVVKLWSFKLKFLRDGEVLRI